MLGWCLLQSIPSVSDYIVTCCRNKQSLQKVLFMLTVLESCDQFESLTEVFQCFEMLAFLWGVSLNLAFC